jgi:outer membrane protein TolC
MKEAYAAEGTILLAEEQYHKTVAAKEKMEALKESLRASESILKGAAMQYDLDPSKTSDLISAYTQNVNLQKDYYMAICKYNLAMAELIAKMGMRLSDYRTLRNIP